MKYVAVDRQQILVLTITESTHWVIVLQENYDGMNRRFELEGII
jgi:hypothetical protein